MNLTTCFSETEGFKDALEDKAADDDASGGKEDGWDLDDADLELPSTVQNAGGSAEVTTGSTYVAPSVGRVPSQYWSDNSHLVADHVMAGSWSEAMRLLNSQVRLTRSLSYFDM